MKKFIAFFFVLSAFAVISLQYTKTEEFRDPLVKATLPTSYLWQGDFEEGNLDDLYNPDTVVTYQTNKNYLGGEYNTGLGDSVVTSELAHTGNYSVKSTITTPSSPSSGTRLYRWGETQKNKSLYFGAWYYIPVQTKVTEWWGLMQWKSKVNSGPKVGANDPVWVIDVGNRSTGEMYLYLWDSLSSKGYYQSIKNLPVGQWFHLEAYYKQASDNTGEVTIWQDDVQIFNLTNVITKRYSDTSLEGRDEIQWSVTHYSSGLTPSVNPIFIDDMHIGLTRDTAPTVTKADDVLPIVNITSPANGAILRTGNRYTIQAQASDNQKVSSVQISLNSKVLCTDTASPYTCSWRVPRGSNLSYLIEAKAVDASGNSAINSVRVTTK